MSSSFLPSYNTLHDHIYTAQTRKNVANITDDHSKVCYLLKVLFLNLTLTHVSWDDDFVDRGAR